MSHTFTHWRNIITTVQVWYSIFNFNVTFICVKKVNDIVHKLAASLIINTAVSNTCCMYSNKNVSNLVQTIHSALLQLYCNSSLRSFMKFIIGNMHTFWWRILNRLKTIWRVALTLKFSIASDNFEGNNINLAQWQHVCLWTSQLWVQIQINLYDFDSSHRPSPFCMYNNIVHAD